MAARASLGDGARAPAGDALARGVLALVAALLVACPFRASGPPPDAGPPLRLSEVAATGDATRRASMRLVLDGLDADVLGEGLRAVDRYERSLVLDPGNPYAYLALARHRIVVGDGEGALRYLDQAELLLRSEAPALGGSGALPPRVEAHLAGLRGAALRVLGRGEAADRHLDAARALAPTVWGDGVLSADELR